MKYTNSELFRFIIAGGVTTLLSYLIYILLIIFLPYKSAYSISFICGIVISYTVNTIFVFQQSWAWKKLFQFPLVYLIQYVLGLSLLAIFVDRLHIDIKVAPLINVVILVPVTYYISRWIITLGVKHEG